MDKWLKWAKEIQGLAQSGLAYTTNVYDIERYERLREISAEMIEEKSNINLEKVKDLFCNETGYQTPKIDTRAAIGTFVISYVVSKILAKKIRKIDMVTSLKGNE